MGLPIFPPLRHRPSQEGAASLYHCLKQIGEKLLLVLSLGFKSCWLLKAKRRRVFRVSLYSKIRVSITKSEEQIGGVVMSVWQIRITALFDLLVV